MTSINDRINRLAARATALNLQTEPDMLPRLEAYFELLLRWNEKINLTSLGDTDEAIDRLLLEPVAAAAFLPSRARIIDIGSGGGSPAIPLAIASRAQVLTMVESRGRKAAFLREALRTLDIDGSVEMERAEALAASSRFVKAADVVSVRAVRMTPALSAALAQLLAPGGVLALFSREAEQVPDGFRTVATHPLVHATRSVLHCFSLSK